MKTQHSHKKINKFVKKQKDTDWLSGYKDKTRIYAVYKRHTSDIGTHTD